MNNINDVSQGNFLFKLNSEHKLSKLHVDKLQLLKVTIRINCVFVYVHLL